MQSEDRCDDGFGSLSERASSALKGTKDRELYAKTACETWLDVRTFGQVFAFKDNKGVSVGVRGPCRSIRPSVCRQWKWSRCKLPKVSTGEKGEKGGNRTSDTMGMKHFVRFGVYVVKGSINVQLAEKTGFSYEDAQIVKECLRTLFVNDASSARPEGSMEVVKLYWWEHNCKDGQYSSAKVHRSLTITPKDPAGFPKAWRIMS